METQQITSLLITLNIPTQFLLYTQLYSSYTSHRNIQFMNYLKSQIHLIVL